MRQLFEFIKQYNFIILFVILEIVAILLLNKSSYYQNSKMTSWANSIAGGWYSGVSSVDEYFGLRHENELLAKENAQLRAQLESSYIHYTDSVFEVHDTVYKQRYDYTEAQIIKNSWNHDNNYIMINKGSLHGIHPDMAVISPQGIVGVVVNTTRNFSTIMPILHRNSRNSVKIKRTGTTGSLVWKGRNAQHATVIDIPTTHKLYKNDTIITSGLANDFPEGIMVGYIEGLSSVPGSGFYEVNVRLSTDFNKLDYVYVVDNHFKSEQDSLMRTVLADIDGKEEQR